MKVFNRYLCGSIIAVLIGAASLTHEVLGDGSKVIKSVPTTHKVVALTIDDGPHPLTTPEILAVLREKNVTATFFALGRNIENRLDILAEVAAAGHEIGNHAYSHRFSHQTSQAEYMEEVKRTETLISKVAPKPILFRPPGGGYNDNLVMLLKNSGYTIVLWSIDPRDWTRPPVAQVVEHVVNNVKNGSIILLHDGQDRLPTPKAIGQIVDRLRAQGYEFVTVSQLLQYYEVQH